MSRPAKNESERLVLFSVRIPPDLKAAIVAEANEAGCTLSDSLRRYVSAEHVQPLAKPRPRQRQPKELSATSNADPKLLRILAGIGNNINQLSHVVNSSVLTGTAIQSVDILTVLCSIEKQLERISTPVIVRPGTEKAGVEHAD